MEVWEGWKGGSKNFEEGFGERWKEMRKWGNREKGRDGNKAGKKGKQGGEKDVEVRGEGTLRMGWKKIMKKGGWRKELK